MDDLEFFDTLYQGWSKTTGAEDMYWEPELYQGQCHVIWAVDQDGNRKRVATGMTESDAAWITALHGCFADLTRRLHQAVDEAERFEIEKDNVICEMAQLAEENNNLREQAAQLKGDISYRRNGGTVG